MGRKRGRVPLAARYTLARLAESRGESLQPTDFEGWKTTRGPRAFVAA
jgi:hypothetical protein